MLVTWRYKERKSLIQSLRSAGLDHLLRLFYRLDCLFLGLALFKCFLLMAIYGRDFFVDRLEGNESRMDLYRCFYRILLDAHLPNRPRRHGALRD